MEVDIPNSSNRGECTICLTEKVSLLPLVCRHSFCGACLKKMDQCPMCRKLIELKDVLDGPTFIFKCAPCEGNFKSEKMRVCIDCATTNNVEVRLNNIDKMKSVSFCLSCIFPDHIDKGHRSVSLLDYDVERRQLLHNQRRADELLKIFSEISDKTKTSIRYNGMIVKILNHVKATQMSSTESSLLCTFLDIVEKELVVIESATKTQNDRLTSIIELLPKEFQQLFDVNNISSLFTNQTSIMPMPNITEFYRGSKLGFDEAKWNQLGEKEDAISFTVSEPVILHYVGIFGSKKKESFQITLKILERKEEGFVLKATQTESIESSGRQLVHNIMIPDPVQLFPNYKYHVVLLVKPLSGSNCRAFYIHSGETKITEVMCGRLVRVEIFNSSLSKNGTGDDDGQIPLFGLSLPDGNMPGATPPSSSVIFNGQLTGSRNSSKSSDSDACSVSGFSDVSDVEMRPRTVKRAKRDCIKMLKQKEEDCKMQ